MKSVLLNKHNLEIAKLAPNQESRYTLNAIKVTADETATTNGHYLIRVTLPKSKDTDLANYPNVAGDVESVECDGMLIPSKAAVEILKALPKERSMTILNHAKVGKDAEGNVRAMITDLATHRPMCHKAMVGQFPNIEAVMPLAEPTLRIGVSADYLSKLLAVAATYQERSSFVELSFWDANKAMRIDAKDDVTGQHFVAILMPMRGDVGDRPWMWNKTEPPVCPFKDVPEFVEAATA